MWKYVYVLILIKKYVGLHFGQFFHKLIWSPWYLGRCCKQTVTMPGTDSMIFELKYFDQKKLGFLTENKMRENFVPL
jgi:hypothetical protein